MTFDVNEVSVNNQGMTDEQIEELLDSGDTVAIAKFLDGNVNAENPEPTPDPEPEPEPEELEPEPEPEPDDKTGDSSTAKVEQPKAEAEPQPERVILSKDGKHQIPYEVLTSSREAEKQARNELAETQKLVAELQRQLADGSKNGDEIDPTNFSAEQLKALEEYGDIGTAVISLAQANKELKEQLASQPKALTVEELDANDSQKAFAANKSLSDWHDNDRDRYEFAVTVDQKLRVDPAFQNKTYAERYAEVERRTKAAFGDSVADTSIEEKAAKRIADAEKDTHPRSLSDIGAAPTVEKPLHQKLDDMNPLELQAYIDKLPAAEAQKLLDSLA